MKIMALILHINFPRDNILNQMAITQEKAEDLIRQAEQLISK
jgi:hypothetical protein